MRRRGRNGQARPPDHPGYPVRPAGLACPGPLVVLAPLLNHGPGVITIRAVWSAECRPEQYEISGAKTTAVQEPRR